MNKFIKATTFLRYLFDQDSLVEKAAGVVLKRQLTLAATRLRLLHNQVVAAFAQLVQPLPVRT